MRVFKTTAALTLALAAGLAAEPKTYTVDKNHSDVTFQVRHLMSKVRGRFTDFGGEVVGDLAKPETATVAFTIKAASINTDNENRDNHLRNADFLDVEKHPEITFKSEKVVVKGKDEFEVHGPFTMHGVTKPVVLPVKVTGTAQGRRGEVVGIEINTVLNRKDYGIVWNRVLDTGGLQLGDDVSVSINLELNEARPQPAAEKKDAPKEQAQPAAR